MSPGLKVCPCPRKLIDFFYAVVVGSSEDGDAGCVGDDVAVGVVDPYSVVVDLVHNSVVCRTAQIARHLLGAGQQGMPNDLGRDGVTDDWLPLSCPGG